jgi:hypothetical protein
VAAGDDLACGRVHVDGFAGGVCNRSSQVGQLRTVTADAGQARDALAGRVADNARVHKACDCELLCARSRWRHCTGNHGDLLKRPSTD